MPVNELLTEGRLLDYRPGNNERLSAGSARLEPGQILENRQNQPSSPYGPGVEDSKVNTCAFITL